MKFVIEHLSKNFEQKEVLKDIGFTRDEQNSWKEQPTNRQMGSKRAWGISRAQKP